jgi:hypothetical protein
MIVHVPAAASTGSFIRLIRSAVRAASGAGPREGENGRNSPVLKAAGGVLGWQSDERDPD